MWSSLMQYVRDDGVTVRELQRLARIAKLALAGMARWGYIAVAPDPADRRLKPPRRDWIVRPTAAGRMAQQVWRPLCDVIEKRWQAHFGKDEIGRLREALLALVSQFDADLPEYLPVLQFGLFSGDLYGPGRTGKPEPVPPNLRLPALLSQVLLAFTIQFERESEVSLAIGANVLRLLSETGVPVRDLPRLSGVSKEAIRMAVGFLVARRYMVVETDPAASRIKVVRLTAKGRKAQDAYRELLGGIEKRWQARFGEDAIRNLRESLGRLVGEPTAELSPLFRC